MDVLPLSVADRPDEKTEFAGFDAVRAGAVLGVLLLHSCVPYLRYPMPGLAWPVRDTSNALVDFGFWWIELFIMPLFLVLAGFLAWQTLQRRGAGGLVCNRARRLLKPLAFAMVVVLPLDLYAWVLGWVAEGVVPAVKLKSLKFDGGVDRDLWGLSHLWFLQYLFLYIVVLGAAYSLGQRLPRLRKIRLGTSALMGLLLIAGSIVVYVRPEVVWGFQHSFLPVASKWVYSGLFFAFGVLLAAHDRNLSSLQRWTSRLWMPALAISVAAVLLGRWQLAGGDTSLARATLATLTCGSGFLLASVTIGFAVSRISSVTITVRYLAAASFWVYLVHHPIIGLVHLDLKWLLPESSPVVKTVLAFLVTSGVCLLLYEGLVRRSRLGRWLGFSWHPPVSSSGDGTRMQPVISIDGRYSSDRRRAA